MLNIWIISIITSLLLLSSCSKKPKHPLSGDEYIVITKNNTFTTYKIVKSTKQRIWFVQNDYEVSKKEYLDSISVNPYTNNLTELTREEFNNLDVTYFRNTKSQEKQ